MVKSNLDFRCADDSVVLELATSHSQPVAVIRVNSRASWFKTLFIDSLRSSFRLSKAVFLRYAPILSNAYPHALWRGWPGMPDFLIHSYDSFDSERIGIPCKKTFQNCLSCFNLINISSTEFSVSPADE